MVARPGNPNDGICRLWRAQVTPPTPLVEYLAQHGRAISYRYLKQQYPPPGLRSASRYPSSLPGWSRAPASQGIGSSQWAPPSCARWRPPRDQTAASGQLAARIVTGLVTGLHVPEASHLLLLEAVAGAELVGAACAAAVERRYLWHEVGDSTLFLPDLA